MDMPGLAIRNIPELYIRKIKKSEIAVNINKSLIINGEIQRHIKFFVTTRVGLESQIHNYFPKEYLDIRIINNSS